MNALELKSLLTPGEWAEGRAAGEESFLKRLEAEVGHLGRTMGVITAQVLASSQSGWSLRERGFLQGVLGCEDCQMGALPEEFWAISAFLCADVHQGGGYSAYLFGILDSIVPPSPTEQWKMAA